MKPKDYEIAKELKKRLSEVVDLIDFRVFGSRARKEALFTYRLKQAEEFIEEIKKIIHRG